MSDWYDDWEPPEPAEPPEPDWDAGTEARYEAERERAPWYDEDDFVINRTTEDPGSVLESGCKEEATPTEEMP